MATTQNDRAVISLVINGEQAKASLKEISLATTRLRSEVLKLKEADNPELYRQKVKELNAMNAAYRAQMSTLSQVTTAWQRFKKEMGTVAVGVVGGNVMTWGLQQFASLVPDTINRTMKLRDAYADMAKATNQSTDQVKSLNKELKQIDTRTTNDELRTIVVAGGQLGVANAQMIDFVKNTDMAVVALGDEFKGGAEEVGKTFGGIAKLYKETKAMNIGDAINDIGSAVNELGASGSATGPVIADFTTRIGQLGDLAPSLAMTMALGAAFQELGLTAEIGASGLTSILSTAAKQSDLFAQQLKMTKKQVEELINTRPDDFLRQLAASFKGMTATQVQQQMAALKVESQEAGKVMSIMAGNMDEVEKKFRLTTKAMAEGTSLQNEFSKKNHQLARDLKDLKEWFNGLLTAEGLQQFLEKAVHNTVELTKVLSRLGPWLKENREYMYLFAAATVAYYGATIKATAATVANTVAETYRKVAYEAGFRWLIISEAATKAYAFTTGVLTGQITLQTAAVTIARGVWAGFNAILLANPIGAVVAAFTGLVLIMKHSSETAEQNLRVVREQARIQFELKREIFNHSRAQQELNEKVSDYNTLSAQEQANTKKSIALKMAEASARLANLKARARELAMQAAADNPTMWEQFKYNAENFFNFDGRSLEKDRFKMSRDRMNQAYSGALTGVDQLEKEIDGYKELQKQIERTENLKTTGGTVTPPTIKDKDKKGGLTDAEKAERDKERLKDMLQKERIDAIKVEKGEKARELAALQAKYDEMVVLAHGNAEDLKEIERLKRIHIAAINKEYDLKAKEQEEELAKQKLQDTEQELELERQQRSREIQRQLDEGKLTQEQARMGELNNEEIYLEAKQLLYSGHYKSMEELFKGFADKEKDIAEKRRKDLKKIDTEIQKNQTEKGEQQSKNAKESEEGTLEEIELKEKLKKAQQEVTDTYLKTGTMAVDAVKSMVQEHTVAYKAAIIAQKAFAIAEVIINLNRRMAMIDTAMWSYSLPDGGVSIRSAQKTAARVEAGVTIAAITAAGMKELASKGTQLNPGTPAKAIGGYTDISTLRTDMSGSPSGFVSDPTYFALGSRSYIAGEAGQEFIINNRALQSPVVANFARMINAVQQSGNYSVLSGGPAAQGSGPAVSVDQSAVLAEMRALNRQMQNMSSAVLTAMSDSNNYFRLKKRDERVDEIRKNSSL